MRFALPPYATCSFCDDLSGARGCAIVAENKHAVAKLDERQYERGAMLVIPKNHLESVLDIQRQEFKAVYSLAQDVARAATKAFGAGGMNVLKNYSQRSGQHEPHFAANTPGFNHARRSFQSFARDSICRSLSRRSAFLPIKLASQRGNIDCGGLSYLIVRYGKFFQFVLPTQWGHVSVCFEPTANPVELGGKVARVIQDRTARSV